MFDLHLIAYWPWALGAAAAVGLTTGLIVRLVQKASVLLVIGETFETTLYATLGCAGGLLGGLFFGQIFPPGLYGTIAFALALVCLAGIALGLIHGNAHAGYKAIGVIVYLLLATALVAGGILAWMSDGGPGFIAGFAAVLAFMGALTGILVALYRSAHWALGWLLVPLNASWGALGNLTGLWIHTGSWAFFSGAASAQPRPRRVYPNSRRRFFHCWENGMRIMPDYFFSQGPVMTAWNDHGMWHEAVHVVQHYIFGPLMILSYVAWAIVMGLVGGIVGLATGNGAVHGAFAWAYVNNPWEVWEYESSWGNSGKSARLVSPTVVRPGKNASDLVFGLTLAWVLTVIWILLWVVAFALWVIFR